GHVLEQAKLFQVLFKSIFPSNFRSASSPRAVDYHSFNSPNWCSLWYPLEMSKPSQPSFPHLVDYRIDIKFCSENSVRYHVNPCFTTCPSQHSQFRHFHPVRLGFRDRPTL
ncbi:hypothetical protein Tco_0204299, partial [Tanacetum coccineum]